MKKLLLILLLVLSFCLIACEKESGSKIKINPNQGNTNTPSTDPKDPEETEEQPKERDKVLLGIDLIDENLDIFKGKKVGLITNATGINSNYQSTIDILYKKVNLTSLFAPEHGIRGANPAGGTVTDETDPVTNLPVYSLYGSTSTPTESMLENVDVMCIDIQDVGARFYTYIYTMANAMKACKQYNKEFVVFDRPNPVSGSVVEGTVLEMTYSSFIGMYPIVQRHGMTIGEIAKYFNEAQGIGCKLTVIKMKNWERDMYFDECDVPWVLPSPNMPTLDTAIVYTGTCLFEGTNLSEGRGTTRPFELIGAPWIDAIELSNELNSLGLSGVYFRPASFTPTTSKFSGQQCFGVQVHVTDRYTFESVKTGYAMLEVIRTLYPSNFQVLNASASRCTLNLLTGCNYITNHTYTLEQQFKLIEKGSEEFEETRKAYLLY
ncbi:MAG: DUF1343 domain-containing protein [Bacilli bacterium]|nr:DUF1343 domain-containing protein [Bacilli bacterium]